MGWRLGEIRPINKQAGARPIVDETNSVVALVLLGSEAKNRNVEIVMRAREIVEAFEALEESHPIVSRLREAVGSNFLMSAADNQPA